MATNQHTPRTFTRQPQSVLATVASKTTTEAATAPKQEGVNNGQSVNFSGTYLYETFVEHMNEQMNAVEMTRLAIVKKAVSQVDTATWKKALVEMVDKAKEKYPAKKGDPVPSKVQVARNAQTFLRNVYGALKNADSELKELGFNDKTGYQDAVAMARLALEKKKVKWDGTPLLPKDIRDERATQREELAVLNSLQKMFPIQQGESISDYNNRIMGKYDAALEDHRKEKLDAQIDAQAKKLLSSFPELAGDIAERVLILLQEQEFETEQQATEPVQEEQVPENVH